MSRPAGSTMAANAAALNQLWNLNVAKTVV
jgi:hypothetical protein